jgi:hypothetical protein
VRSWSGERQIAVENRGRSWLTITTPPPGFFVSVDSKEVMEVLSSLFSISSASVDSKRLTKNIMGHELWGGGLQRRARN